MPEAQRPEEDRDEVLNPAVERGRTKCERRNMRGCCVVEETDQNVGCDENPSPSENNPHISGESSYERPPPVVYLKGTSTRLPTADDLRRGMA